MAEQIVSNLWANATSQKDALKLAIDFQMAVGQQGVIKAGYATSTLDVASHDPIFSLSELEQAQDLIEEIETARQTGIGPPEPHKRDSKCKTR